MNKESYNQIIDEAYKNYLYQTFSGCDEKWLKELDGMNMQTGEKSKVYRQYHKGEFINRIKTDSEFSERWGLKIEERELSLEERSRYAQSNHYEVSLKIQTFTGIDEGQTLHKHLDTINIPTKLITVTYKDEKIQIYE